MRDKANNFDIHLRDANGSKIIEQPRPSARQAANFDGTFTSCVIHEAPGKRFDLYVPECGGIDLHGADGAALTIGIGYEDHDSPSRKHVQSWYIPKESLKGPLLISAFWRRKEGIGRPSPRAFTFPKPIGRGRDATQETSWQSNYKARWHSVAVFWTPGECTVQSARPLSRPVEVTDALDISLLAVFAHEKRVICFEDFVRLDGKHGQTSTFEWLNEGISAPKPAQHRAAREVQHLLAASASMSLTSPLTGTRECRPRTNVNYYESPPSDGSEDEAQDGDSDVHDSAEQHSTTRRLRSNRGLQASKPLVLPGAKRPHWMTSLPEDEDDEEEMPKRAKHSMQSDLQQIQDTSTVTPVSPARPSARSGAPSPAASNKPRSPPAVEPSRTKRSPSVTDIKKEDWDESKFKKESAPGAQAPVATWRLPSTTPSQDGGAHMQADGPARVESGNIFENNAAMLRRLRRIKENREQEEIEMILLQRGLNPYDL